MRKILVSAYACELLKGSESGVGWNWILQMAKTNELHVITRANNRELIELHFPQELKNNVYFYYYDTGNFIRCFKNRAKGLYFYYFFWQLGIISLIRQLIKITKFDYSMHLTFGSLWMPTFLPFFKIPFIWGPIGGGECIPKSFIKIMPFRQRLVQRLRYVLNIASILNPNIFIPSCKAVTILARTENSAAVIPKIFSQKVNVVLETAIEQDIFTYSEISKDNKIIKLIITGRLVPFKNVMVAIRSLQYIPSSYSYECVIVGSGNEKAKILQELKKNNLSHRIRLLGETTRENVLKELTQSDIFLFPSLREGGSWALMEAMAIGLPVVCLNWSGMAIITDDESAIRLPVTNSEQMPKDMAEAICKLIGNPTLREQMGKAGRERIKTVFNWGAKGEFMENLFVRLDSRKEKKK